MCVCIETHSCVCVTLHVRIYAHTKYINIRYIMQKKKLFDVLIALQINRFDSTSLKYQSAFSHVFSENACANVTRYSGTICMIQIYNILY